MHTCPKDFVENRNISNILEESPPLRNKLEFIGELCRSTRLQSRLEAPLFRD